MPYDFPTNPVNGQVYDKFVYSSDKQGWVSADSVEAIEIRVINAEKLAPIGSIHMYAGGQAPRGYVFCLGQALSRSEYANLFTRIGTTYGTGDGSTTFNVPNLQGRVPVGKTTSGTFTNLNATGGSETHTLTTAELPSHNHTQNSHNHTQNAHNHTSIFIDSSQLRWGLGFAGGGLGVISNGATGQTPYTGSTTAGNQNTTATNQNTGGGGAHNNLQPYNTVNYIIKF